MDVAGDDEALRALYASAYPRLVGVLAVAAGDRVEAEDVVQEAFIRLLPRWEAIGRYDDPEAWLRKVAFRLLSTRRRRARLGRRLAGQEIAGTPAPSADRVDISRALAALPVQQRVVVVLHHLLDLPVDVVAAELGIPVGTVKSRLSRARQALSPLLDSEVNDHA
jgi:RNA polymerase sigma-70 factor, ECF subfamily